MQSSEMRIQIGRRAASSADFYQTKGADAIMRAAHFPDEILFFLQMESLVTLGAAARCDCDALVEFGCYDGRALEVARAASLRYVGIDVNRSAIESLRQRIRDERLEGQANAVIGSVLNKREWLDEMHSIRPLQLLPFNLLGNFPEPGEVLRSMRAAGGVAVISVFNEEKWTIDVRREYYTACDIQLLEEDDGAYGGVLFRGSDGFQSQSFSAAGISELLKESGATLLAETANRFGRCVTVRFP
jgi:hypothetical protein